MKNLVKWLLIVLCIASCKHKGHLNQIDIVYLFDNTDTNRIIPDANSVLRLYNYNTKRLCYGASFRLSYISDFEMNEEIEFNIPNEAEGEKENLLDDPLFRKKEVLVFREKVFNAIKTTQTISLKTKQESKVFEGVCKEIENLFQRKSDKKILIVSSDLVENSELLYGYKESFTRIIKEDRKKVLETIIQKFEDADYLNDSLEGIDIYVLYQPNTKEEDIRFSIFREVYRKLLESRGAKVYVKSTNLLKQYNHE